VTLSSRNQKALDAVARLPMGEDDWRRAAFRNQLHESAGLSRGAMQRAVAELAAEGLVEVQKVGRSARLPEGYRITERGLAHASQREPVREPALIQSVGSGLNSSSPNDKEKKEPTKELAHGDPVSQPREPAPILVTVELGPQSIAALFAVAGVKVCRCPVPRPLVEREQGKSGLRFLGCVLGKGGCGLTLPVGRPRWAPRHEPAEAPRERPANDLSTLTLQDVLRRTSESKKPPTTQTSPHQRATTTMRDERTA
jgi:DNA-binding PadR family transcriptional regulator